MGFPAHDAVFIFFASLTVIFKSSVFNIFNSKAFVFNKCGNVLSSFFSMEENEFFTSSFFNDVWNKFIFVLKIKFASSNLPENLQGAP